MLPRFYYLVVFLLLNVCVANASTYNVDGIFSNGALLTGTLGLNNGLLTSVDLHANGSIPGDGATNWMGTPNLDSCSGSCAPESSGVSFSSSYLVGSFNVQETYLPLSQTYAFAFNGGGTLAFLDLNFTLQPLGLILAARVFDPACIGSFCPVPASFVGGSVTAATPVPATLPLFASGLAGAGVFRWAKRRKQKAAAKAA
jgi:hypothetical protein